MGREGIEGYSDKTGGRVEINPEDSGGPIASESAQSPRCRDEEQLLVLKGSGSVL